MIKRVVSTLCVSCLLATRFFISIAAEEEEDPPVQYIKIDIPTYSISAYDYWFKNGFKRFYIPKDDQGNALFNQSGISATETINITSTQNNSTYTETDTYNLTTSESGNIRGSLYAQESNGNYNITTGAGAAVGNLPFNDTGTVSGSVTSSGTIKNGNITSTGNTSIQAVNESQIKYIYDLPWLTGQYVHQSAFSTEYSIRIAEGESIYFSFYINHNLWSSAYSDALNGGYYYLYPRYPEEQEFTHERVSTTTSNSLYFYTFKITCTRSVENAGNNRFVIDFPNIRDDSLIIPLYIGNGIGLSDDEKSAFGIKTNLENTIISGTSDSQYTESNVSLSNNTLSNKVNSLENYESTFNSNLNSSLNLITLPDVNGVVKFGNAARWVSAQYTRIANDQRINFPLIFCLTLGLALTILGRIRT